MPGRAQWHPRNGEGDGFPVTALPLERASEREAVGMADAAMMLQAMVADRARPFQQRRGRTRRMGRANVDDSRRFPLDEAGVEVRQDCREGVSEEDRQPVHVRADVMSRTLA
jgi:hypothetical protein